MHHWSHHREGDLSTSGGGGIFIQGVSIQGSALGGSASRRGLHDPRGVCIQGVGRPPCQDTTEYGQRAGGTHPTRMNPR